MPHQKIKKKIVDCEIKPRQFIACDVPSPGRNPTQDPVGFNRILNCRNPTQDPIEFNRILNCSKQPTRNRILIMIFKILLKTPLDLTWPCRILSDLTWEARSAVSCRILHKILQDPTGSYRIL